MRKHMWSACCHTQAGMARTSNALCFGGRPGALYRVVLQRRAALGGA